MKVQTGNMWSIYDETDLFLITTNSFLKKDDSRLVMGAGIAKQARDKFKDVNLDRALGMAIEDRCGHLGEYGLIVSEFWPISKLGIFQVKYHWKDKAKYALIERSTDMLCKWIEKNNPARVDINYPGIGNGGLDEKTVHGFIQKLPGCVNVWKLH